MSLKKSLKKEITSFLEGKEFNETYSRVIRLEKGKYTVHSRGEQCRLSNWYILMNKERYPLERALPLGDFLYIIKFMNIDLSMMLDD